MARIFESHVFLSDDASKSLQMRLREAISAAIWRGRFAPGDRLPATRRLAAHLNIARITVSLAYEDLAADGYLEASARSGFFVARDAPRMQRPPAPPAPEDEIDWPARLGGEIRGIGGPAKPANWRDYAYPFIFGQADLDRFPLDEWRACARQALGKQSFGAISGDFGEADDPMLVEQILRRSMPGRSIEARPDEVLVTLGVQHSLWLICQMLFARRPALVAVEEPGYPEIRRILECLGVAQAPVPVDRDGVIVERIPAGADAVFVTPSHQAPTGATMSMARRKALLELAEARDLVIFEDDYDFEMSYLRPHSPALKSLDRRGRVIYLGSFSKSLFPGLRLGYLSAPAAFVRQARALRSLIARHPPGLTQRATAHFLALGHYNAHARNLRARMARRRALLLETLGARGIAALPGNDFGGGSIWVEGPAELRATALAQALKARGVLIEPGRPFFAAADAPDRFFRLGFSSMPASKIPAGAGLVVDELETQIGRRLSPAPDGGAGVPTRRER